MVPMQEEIRMNGVILMLQFFLDEMKGNILDEEFKLYKLRRGIDSRIEPVLIDDKNNPGGFASEVLKSGIIVFQSK